MKLSNLTKTLKEEKEEEEDKENDSDSESSSSSEDEEDDKEDLPELEAAMIKHNGCVNRIRTVSIEGKHLAATWSENAKVYIWDLSLPIKAVNDERVMSEYVKQTSPLPVFQFNGHINEGFALDWSPVTPGVLASGDCSKNIHIWKPNEGFTSWSVDQRPYLAHTASVEDIQWSPNESNVFASCSVDKSIRIWDARASPAKACMITCENAHTSDVNVISWNRNEPFIASGGDDAYIKIWDLRLFQEGKSVGILKHHTKPITSIEWNQNDSTVFAASGEDDLLTIWDLALEKDDEEKMDADDNNNDNIECETKTDEINGVKVEDLPPQLLFIHQGQKEMKELHWHSQIPGCIISTAHSGFNVFKTISV